MFETHYTELVLAIDEIAERVRVLGNKAPGSYSKFSESSSVKEDVELEKSANDEGTNSFQGARIEYHEKNGLDA